jgi:hypothetical protein
MSEKEKILAAIPKIQARVDTDLLRVQQAPHATAQHKLDAKKFHDLLQSDLTSAANEVNSATSDPVAIAAWASWAGDSILSELQGMAGVLNAALTDPLGVCTYPDGTGGTLQACLTKAQCDTLPNSNWSQGGCP